MTEEVRLNMAKMEKDLEFIKKDFHEFKGESKHNHRDITASIKEILNNQRLFEKSASENFVSKKKHHEDIESLRTDMKQANIESKSNTRYWVDIILKILPWIVAASSVAISYMISKGGQP